MVLLLVLSTKLVQFADTIPTSRIRRNDDTHPSVTTLPSSAQTTPTQASPTEPESVFSDIEETLPTNQEDELTDLTQESSGSQSSADDLTTGNSIEGSGVIPTPFVPDLLETNLTSETAIEHIGEFSSDVNTDLTDPEEIKISKYGVHAQHIQNVASHSTFIKLVVPVSIIPYAEELQSVEGVINQTAISVAQTYNTFKERFESGILKNYSRSDIKKLCDGESDIVIDAALLTAACPI